MLHFFKAYKPPHLVFSTLLVRETDCLKAGSEKKIKAGSEPYFFSPPGPTKIWYGSSWMPPLLLITVLLVHILQLELRKL